MSVIMKAVGLRKVFGNFVANDDVDFEIENGKIYAIAGENGAGKSTLMKMIYGIYKIDGGKLYIDGEEITKYNPSVAREKGFGMVFQDFRLVPAFTALENAFLSLSTDDTGFRFNKKKLRAQMNELSEKYSMHVAPDEYIYRLDLGQRQHVEIVKVLMNKKTRVLIFDEPTSVLAPNEIDSFLELLLTFKKNDFAIILITHKIQEIIKVADVVHILRKGRMTHKFLREDGFSHTAIVSAMLGQGDGGETVDLSGVQEQFTGKVDDASGFGETVFTLSGGVIKDASGRTVIKKANFEIRAGQILGVAGISGNGQRELSEAVYGMTPLTEGKITLSGKDITGMKIPARLASGIRMLSEDPIRDNLFPDYTVLEHMAISGFDYKRKGLSIDWSDLGEQIDGCEEIKSLNVPDKKRVAERLSGGNIQRMAFARAIIAKPKLLIACYPSRGLDVATVKAVHDTLLRLRNGGCAIIFISEDLDELFNLSDRLIVLAENTAYGPFVPEQFDRNKIGDIMLRGAEEP